MKMFYDLKICCSNHIDLVLKMQKYKPEYSWKYFSNYNDFVQIHPIHEKLQMFFYNEICNYTTVINNWFQTPWWVQIEKSTI